MSHQNQHQARGVTAQGASRKRKATESGFLGGYSQYKPMMMMMTAHDSAYTYTAHRAASKPDPSNWILAGYMAHEFLTYGTLLGHELEREAEPKPGGKEAEKSYADVANVLRIDGTHVPGVVNPTQLARWIQM